MVLDWEWLTRSTLQKKKEKKRTVTEWILYYKEGFITQNIIYLFI